MSIIKYGVMIPFDDSHMWVSKDSKDQELKPLLFDTQEEAYNHADIWGPLAVVAEYEVTE